LDGPLTNYLFSLTIRNPRWSWGQI